MSDPGKAGDLLAQIPKGEGKGLPPVHLWNTDFLSLIHISEPTRPY